MIKPQYFFVRVKAISQGTVVNKVFQDLWSGIVKKTMDLLKDQI